MRHHIVRLREKPNHEKKKLAFSISFGITAVVAFVWMASLTLTPIDPLGTNVAVEPEDETTPLSIMSDSVASVFDSFKGAGFFNKKEEPATIEVTGTTR